MERANADIRYEAKKASIPLWAIADYMEISEPTLTRKMRKELSDCEKLKIIDIIKILKGGNTSCPE